MGERERQQVLRLELAEAALQAGPLAEASAPRPGGRKSAASSTGTGCQLWLFSLAGVLWSPVTIRTSGPSSTIAGMLAVELLDAALTLRWKSPSSPAASVYL